MFAELNTAATGNTLHTFTRLKIDSMFMEGIDTDLVNEEFKEV